MHQQGALYQWFVKPLDGRRQFAWLQFQNSHLASQIKSKLQHGFPASELGEKTHH